MRLPAFHACATLLLLSVMLAAASPDVPAGTLTRSNPNQIPRTELDDRPAQLVSAFFGLDHALPWKALRLCRQAPGLDGIPVTFSRRLVGGPHLDPNVFTVKTRSGAQHHPVCATTAPAHSAGKRHTVLLIGDLGSEPDDPPETVEVSGDLPLEHGANAKGLSAPVIPLAAGPTLVLAMSYRAQDFPCAAPARARQVVVVVWAGGVKPRPGTDEVAHLEGYRVATDHGDVKPIALGNLGHNDNYVCLFLSDEIPARRVDFAAGILVDPRGDLNPKTSVAVAQSR